MEEFGTLAANGRSLGFVDLSECRGFLKGLNLFETGHAAADGGEVGERSAQPALIDIELTGRFGCFRDGTLGLFFGSDEENFSTIANEIAEVFRRAIDLLDGEPEVDDVNRIFFLEDVIAHLGIPSLGLVSIMDAGLEEFRHEFDAGLVCCGF